MPTTNSLEIGVASSRALAHDLNHGQNICRRRVDMDRLHAGQSMRPAKPRAARTVEGSGMAVMVN